MVICSLPSPKWDDGENWKQNRKLAGCDKNYKTEEENGNKYAVITMCVYIYMRCSHLPLSNCCPDNKATAPDCCPVTIQLPIDWCPATTQLPTEQQPVSNAVSHNLLPDAQQLPVSGWRSATHACPPSLPSGQLHTVLQPSSWCHIAQNSSQLIQASCPPCPLLSLHKGSGSSALSGLAWL